MAEDRIDTETEASLQGMPPDRLAPANDAGFALVLIADFGDDRPRLVRAVARATSVSAEESQCVLGRPLPLPLLRGLPYCDAAIGQFELICCDAVSVIIRDEVLATASASYLSSLYAQLLKSDEFRLVTIRLDLIRDNPGGRDFCDRFLGGRKPTAEPMEVMLKKARIMQHWATKIGGHVTIGA